MQDMDKSKLNPTVVFVTVAVLVFALILVVVLRDRPDEPEPVEQPATQQPTEQPAAPETPEQPEQPEQPQPPEEPEQPVEPQPSEEPETPAGRLPDDWDQLTPQQKTDRNPFGCDVETQWISAEDGSCLDKSPQPPARIDSFPFRLGDVSYISCDYDIGYFVPHEGDWTRRESNDQDLRCVMPVHWEPTVDLDPDDTGSLWSHVIRDENKYVRDDRPSSHCLSIDPDIFRVRITDDVAEEAATPISAEQAGTLCRPLAAGDDGFEAVVRFKIPDSFFDKELLRSMTPSDDLRPITTGSTLVSVHLPPEVKKLYVPYAIYGGYAIE